jgi:hypothetical protein
LMDSMICLKITPFTKRASNMVVCIIGLEKFWQSAVAEFWMLVDCTWWYDDVVQLLTATSSARNNGLRRYCSHDGMYRELACAKACIPMARCFEIRSYVSTWVTLIAGRRQNVYPAYLRMPVDQVRDGIARATPYLLVQYIELLRSSKILDILDTS